MSPLRKRMIEDLQVRNYSPKTIEAYVSGVARFARHFGKSPHKLGPDEIRAFQVHLVRQQVSWARFNQTVCALRFLYRHTLGKDWMIEHIPFPRRERKLPQILSRLEVAAFLAAAANLKHRTILTSMQSTGMRVSEALNLRIPDIDSSRMQLASAWAKARRTARCPWPTPCCRSCADTGKPADPPSGSFRGKAPTGP